MNLLLDTHAFLWAILNASKLSRRAAASILDPDNDLVLSSASLWEIAVKVYAGKLFLPVTPEYFGEHMSRIGVKRVLSVTPPHIYETLKLPPVHKDPFDRLLAAQCIVERMRLVSADRVFRNYPIEVIW